MQAIVCTKYGPPEVLQLREVDKPVSKDNEVLIRVKASAVNYNILTLVRGKPIMARLFPHRPWLQL